MHDATSDQDCDCIYCDGLRILGPVVRQMSVVHGLPPMTAEELAAISCGHCRHRLTMHATDPNGNTGCAVCYCFRTADEDIRKPHNFGGVG